MSDPADDPRADRRWPRWVYQVGTEPDPRFSLANERTFLAWIRTSLALIAAGIGIYALTTFEPQWRPAARIAALLAMGSGVISAVAALIRWARGERALRTSRPLPSSVMFALLVIVLIIVGVLLSTLLW